MRAIPVQAIILGITTVRLFAGDAGPLSLTERGAPTPSFTLLGDLPGGAFMSRATAVSADGTTVVGYSESTALDPNGGHEAFRWKDGQMIGLGGTFPGSGRFSRATGVNGDGSIVLGDTRFFSLDQPFRWQNGVMQSAFIEESYAGEMSTNGNFAVTSTFGPGVRGYRVQFNGISHQVPILPGGDSTGSGVNVHGISSDGSTVIGRSHSAGNLIQAIRWKFGVGTTPIGFLPGCIDNEATAVSADGNLVIGRCWIIGLPAQPFQWTPENGIQPFVGGLAAVAMSDDATIMIGGEGIWDAQNGVRNLKSVASTWGLGMGGIVSLTPTDISADGTVIVGYAMKSDLTTEAFRLVSPEPAAALLLAPMLVMLRRRGAGYRRSAQHRTHLTAAASPSHA
ncbi:hypothetical protein RAS2_05280 [Phycisphaerae bacterium RAS2]|nr:hypothetical protein RAS2_05280 [Phycisphaerae bacterium RAS2]